MTRLRSSLPILVGIVLVLLATIVAAAISGTRSTTPLAHDNPGPRGARAAAQILERQGVTVEATDHFSRATEAGPGTTLLVTDPALLNPEHRERLAATGADIVAVGGFFMETEGFTEDLDLTGGYPGALVTAMCEDPDASAARALVISDQDAALVVGGDATGCFPTGRGDVYAVDPLPSGGTLRWLTSPLPLSNAGLAQSGNAALVLRALGAHDTLLWYVPAPQTDPSLAAGTATLPSALVPVLAVLAAAALALAAAQGRRLGPLVVERMPVVVRSAETTLGRARLYRRAGAAGHAAAALRAATARRCAQALGLPRHADAPAVVEATAAATGRPEAGPDGVGPLIYGPPPRDDTELVRLAEALATLEKEVHRS